ncbi:MAG: hypothetical protein QG567_2172 [Campylobacterota bacterium]|nr:hypothetical protein [Campylobacterota bacterium]
MSDKCSQIEASKILGISKQYINNLIGRGKIQRYDNKEVSLDEIKNFIYKAPRLTKEEKAIIRLELTKQKHYEAWNLKNITANKFTDFIIDKFFIFFSTYSNDEIIKKLSTISGLIYYYQYSYESKPAKKIMDKNSNKIRTDKKTIKDATDKLLNLLDDRFNEKSKQAKLITAIKDLQKNPYDYIYLPKDLQDIRITKITLAENLKLITLPKNSRLKRKNEKNPHFNKIDKILEALPFENTNLSK